MALDERPVGRVTVSWPEGDRTREAQLQLTTDGIDLDDALDALMDGLTDMGVTVLSGEVVEQVRRRKRERKDRRPDPAPTSAAVQPEQPTTRKRGRA